MDPNPREGLFKALSVAVGEQVTSEQVGMLCFRHLVLCMC